MKRNRPSYARFLRGEIRRLRAEIEFEGRYCETQLRRAACHAAGVISDWGGFRRSAETCAENAFGLARRLDRYRRDLRAGTSEA